MRINTFFRVYLPLVAAFLLCLMILSCSQDAIFYAISIDYEASKPRVDGTPSQIVEYNGKIYVGSLINTKIHVFDGSGWSEIVDAGGSLGGLAATTDALYVLTGPIRGERVIKEYQDGDFTSRTFTVSGNYSIESIFSAKTSTNDYYIFAGLHDLEDERTYALAYAKVSDPGAPTTLTLEEGVKSPLTGAATDGMNIYLSSESSNETGDSGLWQFTGGTVTAVSGTGEMPMVGIINDTDNSRIIAVSRYSNNTSSDHGKIYTYNGSALSPSSEKAYFTGAMAKWEDPNIPSNKLLLLGVDDKNSELYYGYREAPLNDPAFPLRAPGDAQPSTVDNRDSFSNSLGMHAVNFIYQVTTGTGDYAPEGKNSVIFAATQGKGLWSYRKRDGKWTWNAQE